jgi:hypothetical protein
MPKTCRVSTNTPEDRALQDAMFGLTHGQDGNLMTIAERDRLIRQASNKRGVHEYRTGHAFVQDTRTTLKLRHLQDKLKLRKEAAAAAAAAAQ